MAIGSGVRRRAIGKLALIVAVISAVGGTVLVSLSSAPLSDTAPFAVGVLLGAVMWTVGLSVLPALFQYRDDAKAEKWIYYSFVGWLGLVVVGQALR